MPKKRNTKIPTIKQLPSGAYHTQVYSHTDENGKRHYESITSYNYNEVVLAAAQFKADKHAERIEKSTPKSQMYLRDAMAEYISLAEPLSSASTIRSYLSIHKNCLQKIMGVRVCDLTQDRILDAINEDRKRLSIKTLKNVNSLLRLTLEDARPEFHYKVNLNRTEKTDKKKEIQVPTEGEVRKLMEASQGTSMEIPIILTACCGLRPSEISALVWDDFDLEAGTLSISRAVVRNKNNKYVEKGTKSDAGTRVLRLFPLVLDRMREEQAKATSTDSYICIKPNRITDNFRNLRKRLGLRQMRFYDLRHYLVSVMLSLNIPKNYIADYVGHEDETMIDRVYGHIMARRKTSVEDMMYDYFSDIFPKK